LAQNCVYARRPAPIDSADATTGLTIFAASGFPPLRGAVAALVVVVVDDVVDCRAASIAADATSANATQAVTRSARIDPV
jgi:hypothetical protein